MDAMRFKGTIAEWNDDRGFGFIKPAEGGERVFCHIKAFQERSKRPSPSVTVTYELDVTSAGGRKLARFGTGRRRAGNPWPSRPVHRHRPG